MSRVSKKGAETIWKIKGFQLFMNTAERYRAAFNEKENIFEKLLPYAIAFGLTKKWIEATKKIYGTEYINSYHPVWYAGTLGSFDVGSLSSAITSVANAVQSSSSSGSGGSGGGGGGGGGGGW